MVALSVTNASASSNGKSGQFSDWSGTVNIMKSIVGSGILTLSYATKQVGWIPALIGMALIAYMTVMSILFACMAKRCVPVSESECMAMLDSPQEFEDNGMGSFNRAVWRAFGEPGRIIYSLCAAVSQGVCGIAYVVIIADAAK